ncbi:MAG: hypothetical protein LW822_06050 [Phycisphaeraceae bacterium]|nr:hypothetical protein [Phycisphaeraceae bacterium]
MHARHAAPRGAWWYPGTGTGYHHAPRGEDLHHSSLTTHRSSLTTSSAPAEEPVEVEDDVVGTPAPGTTSDPPTLVGRVAVCSLQSCGRSKGNVSLPTRGSVREG